MEIDEHTANLFHWWSVEVLLCVLIISTSHLKRILEEEVIYFNQSLPTSDSILLFLFFSLTNFVCLYSNLTLKEIEWEMKQMVMALICIIIVPLISFSLINKRSQEINENLFFVRFDFIFFDPRGDNLYDNFIFSLPPRGVRKIYKRCVCTLTRFIEFIPVNYI